MSKCSVNIAFSCVDIKTVVIRLSKIRDDIDKLCTFWGSLPKSKRPFLKSYHILKTALDDKWMPAKLRFFKHIASIIEPYLRRYKIDRPMVPFMYYDLKNIVYQLLEAIAKPVFLDSSKAKSQAWKDIDLPKDSNMLESWVSGLPLIKL